MRKLWLKSGIFNLPRFVICDTSARVDAMRARLDRNHGMACIRVSVCTQQYMVYRYIQIYPSQPTQIGLRYIFFKNNLTVPKTKDLVKKPTEQYKQIYSSLKKDKEDTKEMKNELKNYLKTLTASKNKKTENTNNGIETAENIFSANNFTNY